MECLWGLFGYWRTDGYCYQPDQAIFYVRLTADNGLPYYYLHVPGFLEKHAEVYDGGEAESVVLFVGKS